MDKLVVACVQQRMRYPLSNDWYRDDLRRFMRAAQTKHARLIVFPELAGVMTSVPLLGDMRSSLLKQADSGRLRNASLLQRLRSAVAGRMASVLGADLRKEMAGLLDVNAEAVWTAYATLFSDLAREYGMTLVAPSAYLPDPLDGVIRHLAAVFGPGGDLLGTQAKVVLQSEDADVAQAGSGWDVVQTDVGRLGVIVGTDVLYPEVGRLLAYQGAEVLVGMGACQDIATYNKIRSGMLARMQDNQLFALTSFLVGRNELGRHRREPYIGKSAIFAPQELTPRQNGVLVEMVSTRSEGVLSAEWSFQALKDLWESSDTPIRKNLTSPEVSTMLTQLYSRIHQLPDHGEVADPLHDSPAEIAGVVTMSAANLDDLPVFASITSRWPLSDIEAIPEILGDDWEVNAAPSLASEESDAQDGGVVLPRSLPPTTEDETDEMDALPGS